MPEHINRSQNKSDNLCLSLLMSNQHCYRTALLSSGYSTHSAIRLALSQSKKRSRLPTIIARITRHKRMTIIGVRQRPRPPADSNARSKSAIIVNNPSLTSSAHRLSQCLNRFTQAKTDQIICDDRCSSAISIAIGQHCLQCGTQVMLQTD